MQKNFPKIHLKNELKYFNSTFFFLQYENNHFTSYEKVVFVYFFARLYSSHSTE